MDKAMIVEAIVTVFVIAFVGVCVLGHVLLLAALLTPSDQNGSEQDDLPAALGLVRTATVG
jgi:hypothetical protein